MTDLAIGTTTIEITPSNPVVRYTLNFGPTPVHIYSTGSFDTYCRIKTLADDLVINFDDSPGGANFSFTMPNDLAFDTYYADFSLFGQAAEFASFDVTVEVVWDSIESVPIIEVSGNSNIAVVNTDSIDLGITGIYQYESTESVNVLQVAGTTQTYLGVEVIDIVDLGLMPNAAYSFEIYVKPNWISRQFIVKIGDLVLPVASINASLTASGGSYLSLSVPSAGSDLLDEIIARRDQQIIVSRRHRYSDNTTTDREFIRVNYDTLQNDKGGRAASIVLTGRRSIPVGQSKQVTVENIFFERYNNGEKAYRLPIYDEIGLGDLVNDIIVGKISYYITAKDEYMEITEYVANGTDDTGLIGSNIRQTPLQNYLVTPDDVNYSLWQTKGYFYNGRQQNPADTTDYNYYLKYDTAGLLWFAANVPVYLQDGVTQASINI